MTSSSKSRKTNLFETNILAFIDNLSNNVENLYTYDDNKISSDSDIDNKISDNDEIRTIANTNSNRNISTIEAALDESNYDPLPTHGEKTFLSNFGDEEITWTTSKPNVQLNRGLQNIIKNRPGQKRVARTVTNSLNSWKLFMTDNIIRIITMHTNERITEFLEENPVDSAKHTHYKLTDETEAKAFVGLMYLRGALHKNLQDINNQFYHESANQIFSATMNDRRFFFLSNLLKTNKPAK